MTRLKFVPLIHMVKFEDENLSHCVRKSNTRYLERLIINAENVSTVQRPNEDHRQSSVTDFIKFLCLLNMSRLIRKEHFIAQMFPGKSMYL